MATSSTTEHPEIHLSDTNPAAPSGGVNVHWQVDETKNPPDVSAYSNVMTGDSGSGGAEGLVPAPASGDAAAGAYLKADGTWSVPPTGGGGGGGSLPDYSAVILADSPVGYWRLGEYSGHFADSSGNGWNSTAETVVTRSMMGMLENDQNNAVYTSAGSIDIGTSFPQLSSTWAFETWVGVTSIGGHMTMIGRDTTSALGGTSGAFFFKLSSAGDGVPTMVMCYGVSGGSGLQLACPAPHPIQVGFRYHIVGEADGTNLNLYINGELVNSVSLASHAVVAQSGAPSLLCGYFSRSKSDNCIGVFDEMAIYPSSLGATKVTAHYKAGRGVS